ncbi:hypothetical protein THICB6_200079 [Thiomonas arsenitoxydans]|nr:hypothetical protein THICB6_200079 [Thiomonas arsenitoxydans]
MQGWILAKGVIRDVVSLVVSDVSYVQRIKEDGVWRDRRTAEVGFEFVAQMKPRRAVERIASGPTQLAEHVVLLIVDRKAEVGLAMSGVELYVPTRPDLRKRRNLVLQEERPRVVAAIDPELYVVAKVSLGSLGRDVWVGGE